MDLKTKIRMNAKEDLVPERPKLSFLSRPLALIFNLISELRSYIVSPLCVGGTSEAEPDGEFD